MSSGRFKCSWLIVFAVLLISISGIAFATESPDTSEEMPVPISFENGSSLPKNTVLLESIPFDLSDENQVCTYLIPKDSEDLIVLFKEVSEPINFSLKTQGGDSHSAGFDGNTCKVRIDIDPNYEYEFEWTCGFYVDFEASVQEEVDNSSGLLEIYRVIS